jgi:hypothetical protein
MVVRQLRAIEIGKCPQVERRQTGKIQIAGIDRTAFRARAAAR